MTVTSRAFRDEADYAAMRRLLVESFALASPPAPSITGYTVGDLDWWRYTSGSDGAVMEDTQLWFADDRLAAFTMPSEGQVDLIVHPAHRILEPSMLDWVYDRPRARADDGSGRHELSVWAFDGDVERVRLFAERGLRRTDEALCARQRRLDGSIPERPLPDGYRIRHVAGEQDLEHRVAVHRDAFAPSRMTVEKHRNVMRAPTYRRELDLVVEAPDGSFAAYCLVWFDEDNRMGIFEPVGCHSAHRRRGLAAAVMYEGMRRLRALGADIALVNNHPGVQASAALYDSVGMHTLDEVHAWRKPVA